MLGMLWKVLEKSGLGFLYDILGLMNYYPCSVIIGILKLLLLCCGDIKSPTLVDLRDGLVSRTMFMWDGALILLFLRLLFCLWIAVPNIVFICPELLDGLCPGLTPVMPFIPDLDLSMAIKVLLASIIRLLFNRSDIFINYWFGPLETKWGPWKFICWCLPPRWN